ncbi:recombinase family protein, partial [candidate division KSB1 bacterium]|nr:recombinase family protein [candidate division KSB1 bacterium]
PAVHPNVPRRSSKEIRPGAILALDRFTREGLQKTIFYLRQLDDCGVKFHSYTEPYLNTDQELVRDILLSVLASLAKQERRRISGRLKAGLETAKKRGSPGCSNERAPKKRNRKPDKKQLIEKRHRQKTESFPQYNT